MKKILLIAMLSVCTLFTACGSDKRDISEIESFVSIDIEESVQEAETEESSVAIEETTVESITETTAESITEAATNDLENNVMGDAATTESTYIQKNNQTARVKDFDEVLADPNVEYPSEEYVLFGLFYDLYAMPDEVTRYEFIYDESTLTWPKEVPVYLQNIYFGVSYTPSEMFQRYVVETVLSNYTIAAVSTIMSPSKVYPDITSVDFTTDEANMKMFIVQTQEDLEKGENIYSAYVGVSRRFEDF